MSLRGPCGAQLPDRKSEARSPSGGPAGHHQQVEVRSAVTLSAGYPEALVPPGALRGETTRRRSEARSPSGAPAGHHCRALATSNSLLHSLFQHLCYSLLQRLRLAVRGPKPFRRASGARTVCARGRGRLRNDAPRFRRAHSVLHSVYGRGAPKNGSGGGTEAFPARLRRAHSLRAGPRTSPERCAAPPARSQRVAQRVRPRPLRNAIRGSSSAKLKGSVLSPSGQSPIYLSDQYYNYCVGTFFS